MSSLKGYRANNKTTTYVSLADVVSVRSSDRGSVIIGLRGGAQIYIDGRFTTVKQVVADVERVSYER